MQTLKQVIQSFGWRSDGKLLAHAVPFAGDGHFHKINRYSADSPSVIKSKFDVAQAAGVDGFIITWQGSINAVNQRATLEIMAECERRGMIFALLADPWLYANWQARGFSSPESCIIAELTNADGGALLNSPAYLPEGYFLQFKTDWNPTAVVAAIAPAHPYFNVLPVHSGFSWLNSLASSVAVLADLKQQNANPAMRIPGVHWKFWDGGVPSIATQFTGPIRVDANGLDCNTQSWGSGPSRYLFDQSGNTFFDALSVTPMTSPYLALVTWDDPNEETGFEVICSIMSGIRVK